MENWLGQDSLREIRCDGVATVLWLTLAFVCYGEYWPLLLTAGGAFIVARAWEK